MSDPQKPARDEAQRPASKGKTSLFEQGTLLASHFVVERQIGTGGMGRVYEAYDTKLRRRVAVKVAHPTTPAGLLLLEARALAVFSHPGVPAIYTFGDHEGSEFIVMERLYGVPLDEHLRRAEAGGRQLPIAEAVDLLAGAAEALAVVHRAGQVHRDVKTANVMLAPGNRVVLMDFGLTHGEGDRYGHSHAAGTPYYLAPEVIDLKLVQGKAFLADLYALGVLGYRILTGRYPFEGTSEEVTAQHQHVAVSDPQRTRGDLPPALSRLMLALMAKDPSGRPTSADLVARELRDVRRRLANENEKAPFSVVIVDDDEDALRLFGAMVRQAVPDAQIRLAPDGETALRMVRESAPDLLLSDLDLPGMSGLELCMSLRGTSVADRCEMVIISGAATDSDVRLLYQLGLTRFVKKEALAREHVIAITREAKKAFDEARSRALA